MRAIVIEAGELVLRDLPEPAPGPGQMLVRVHAAGLNRADLVARRGAYVVGTSLRRTSPAPPAAPPGEPAAAPGEPAVAPGESTANRPGESTSNRPGPERPVVAGGEVAGEVVALGPDVGGFRVGDRVMAMVRGGYADYVVVEARRALFVPERLGWAEAAATPTTFCTAHDALATAGQLETGEAVLVNAASSGVGVAALQLARLLGASPVIG
ncbi:MAG: alcohol dehydrogenase catalytic domain-containing protein, partial [Acidimicrobiia bacterium]|nr:alcohol dehydrogenase catalytic domain-containing protein [Acidimicrobiia bacterium]